MKPIISVIIPAYNEENYIKDILISLKDQDFNLPYEVIVCDNNSKDKTVQIAKKYADKVVSEEKQGGGYARNKGASIAKGKYFVFTDADTLFPKDYLKKAYEVFLQDKYIAFSGGAKFSELKNKSFLNKTKVFIIEKGYHIMNLFKPSLPGTSFCISKIKFEKSGGFPERYPEDRLMTEKLSKIGELKFFTHFPIYTSPRRVESISVLNGLQFMFKMFFRNKELEFYHRSWEK